jgi:hypothetical protein
MSTLVLILVIIFGVLVLLAIGVALLSWMSERRNPPFGAFLESQGALNVEIRQERQSYCSTATGQ